MSLHCKCYNQGNKHQVALVMLHGFLGNTDEWEPIAENLPKDIPCYAIDLPGHGESKNIVINHLANNSKGFSDTAKLIDETLKQQGLNKVYLLGYSLGGRIALQYAQQFPEKISALILESCHFGLTDSDEKHARLKLDQQWAEKFAEQPLTAVLAQWYQQPVFASLSDVQISQLIAKRQQAAPKALSAMLLATSLAKQPYVPTDFNTGKFPCYYLFGNNDLKYQQIAHQRLAEIKLTLCQNTSQNTSKNTSINTSKTTDNPLVIFPFNDAGHNVHFEQALHYTQLIKKLYRLQS